MKLDAFIRRLATHEATCAGTLQRDGVVVPESVTFILTCATCGVVYRARFTAADLAGCEAADVARLFDHFTRRAIN